MTRRPLPANSGGHRDAARRSAGDPAFPGKRLVFDTSAYIAVIHGGLFSPAFRLLQEKLPRIHLASVVSAELLAGATNQAARRAVLDFVRWAHKVRRVVTPDASSWERAGEILGEIRGKEPQLRSKIPSLWNDLVIVWGPWS